MTANNKYPIISNEEFTFPELTYTFKCSTRIDGSLPKNEATTAYVTVILTGAGADALNVDFAVRYQNSAVRNYFKSQDHYQEWADSNATEDNPHVVHFNQLGSVAQFITLEEKARLLRQELRSAGVDPNNQEEVKKFLKIK